MDLISVIVPVYKVEQYLNKCVESIVNQTYKNLEIILVDDGSQDSCPQICDEWARKDSRVKVLHKENGGLSDARNVGLHIAKGEYVAFVDSDDWLDDEYLEIMHCKINEHDADLVACDFLMAYDDSESVSKVSDFNFEINTTEEAMGYLIKGNKYRAVAWNKLYKADLLRNESFPVGKIHEDEFFSYKIIAKSKKLVYIERPLYYYRQRSGSIMSGFSKKHITVLEAYLERIDLLKSCYPELYGKDKITFCVCCLNLYFEATTLNKNERLEAITLIKDFRKRINFSLTELVNYSFKELLYIGGSSPVWLGLFTKARNLFRKR